MDWKTPQLRQCIIFKPKSKPIYFTHRLTTQTKHLSRGEWGKLGQVLLGSLGFIRFLPNQWTNWILFVILLFLSPSLFNIIKMIKLLMPIFISSHKLP
jgi:hypothetical protein